MRKGFNPNKDKRLETSDFFHQIIIPVYIPNHEAYFKDSLQILKICLESLFKTIHSKTFITVVNNGSSEKVIELLEDYYENNNIHELIHTTNIGKLNAILKGVSGHKFDLITISDADVLFLNNWQESTYSIYNTFKKTGFVSPCPSSKVLKKYTSNIHVENFFNKNLKFTEVKNPSAQVKFAKSIGNKDFYNEHHLEKYLTISNNYIKAVVGGGHFVGTYRGDILRKPKSVFTEYALGSIGMNSVLDKPVEASGYWRLSTEDNYVYHMGNTLEDWMQESSQGKNKNNDAIIKPKLDSKKSYKISRWTKNFLFEKIILRKPIWVAYLRLKGLNNIESTNY